MRTKLVGTVVLVLVLATGMAILSLGSFPDFAFSVQPTVEALEDVLEYVNSVPDLVITHAEVRSEKVKDKATGWALARVYFEVETRGPVVISPRPIRYEIEVLNPRGVTTRGTFVQRANGKATVLSDLIYAPLCTQQPDGSWVSHFRLRITVNPDRAVRETNYKNNQTIYGPRCGASSEDRLQGAWITREGPSWLEVVIRYTSFVGSLTGKAQFIANPLGVVTLNLVQPAETLNARGQIGTRFARNFDCRTAPGFRRVRRVRNQEVKFLCRYGHYSPGEVNPPPRGTMGGLQVWWIRADHSKGRYVPHTEIIALPYEKEWIWTELGAPGNLPPLPSIAGEFLGTPAIVDIAQGPSEFYKVRIAFRIINLGTGGASLGTKGRLTVQYRRRDGTGPTGYQYVEDFPVDHLRPGGSATFTVDAPPRMGESGELCVKSLELRPGSLDDDYEELHLRDFRPHQSLVDAHVRYSDDGVDSVRRMRVTLCAPPDHSRGGLSGGSRLP